MPTDHNLTIKEKRAEQLFKERKYKEAAETHNELGHALRQLSRYEDALIHHQTELRICKLYLKSDKISLAIAHRNVGEVCIELDDEEKAEPHINRYLSISREALDRVEEQRALITLGRLFLYKSDKCKDDEKKISEAQNGLEYYNKAYSVLSNYSLEILNRLGKQEYDQMKTNNCQNLGIAYDLVGQELDAIGWLKKGADIAKESGFRDYSHACWNTLSGIQLRRRNYVDCMESLSNALAAAKSLGDLAMETESTLIQAKCFFFTGKIDQGKDALKKLRKKIKTKPQCESFMPEVNSLLKNGVLICRNLDTLYGLDKENQIEECANLNEKVADCFVAMEIFGPAIKYYENALRHARSGNLDSKKLAQLYFSIAETYKDLGNYASALENYKKELLIHNGNPKEQFKTQTCIALVLEKLGKREDEVESAYVKALDHAETSKNPKLIVNALENRGLYLKSIQRESEAEPCLKLAKEIKEKEGLSDSESAVDSQDLLDGECEDVDNIDLSDLSDDESDEADENEPAPRASICRNEVRVKRTSVRRNEAGETPLHLAAKKGDMTAIRKCIREGHDVNARDTAGWTPLHEAANHGMYEAAKDLISRGAKVNDRGGPECDGITPLHDAISNGHFEVAQLLLHHKADPRIRSDDKSTAMDSLLTWKKNTPPEEKKELKSGYRIVKKMIFEYMETHNYKFVPVHVKEPAKKMKKKKPDIEFGLGPDDCPVRIQEDNFDPTNPEETAKFYKSAINGLRRKRRDVSNEENEKRKRRAMSPGPQSGLIPADKDVHNNWMISDSQEIETMDFEEPSSSSRNPRHIWRRRKNRSLSDEDNVEECSPDSMEIDIPIDYEEASRNSDDIIDVHIIPSPEPSPTSMISSNDSRIGHSRKRSVSERSHENEITVSSESDHESERRSFTSSLRRYVQRRPRETKRDSGERVRDGDREIQSGNSTLTIPRNVKIRLQDELFLIPLGNNPEDKTVNWLRNVAAKRYHETKGILPQLQLKTVDGAILYAEDKILGLLDGEEIVAEVTSFKMPSLCSRLKESADRFEVDASYLMQPFRLCESTGVLKLSAHSLEGPAAKVLSMTLNNDTFLQNITIQGCALFDVGFELLVKVLRSLTGLKVLDVSENGITSIESLVNLITNNPSMCLEEIILDFNPLEAKSEDQLQKLVNESRSLRVLSIIYCDMEEEFCEKISDSMSNGVLVRYKSDVKESPISRALR